MLLLTALNAKYIHSNPAVYQLQAYLSEYAGHIQIAEYTINQSMEEVFRDIYRKKPEIIAFSCYIWNIEYVCRLASDIKKVLPESLILLGGPEVSYDSETLLEKHSNIDYIIRGEGEKALLSFVKWYFDGEGKREDIAGLVYRNHEQGDITESACQDREISVNRSGNMTPMDECVFPYDDLTDFNHRIIYYESSRGCPFSCSYCLSSIEKKVRYRSIEKVREEIRFFLDKEVLQVKFIDRTFNSSRERAYDIWKFIGEQDNGITNFHFEIAGDLLREKDLRLFKGFRQGLIQLEIGIQSTNQTTIEAVNRSMDLKKIKESVDKINRMGNIHQHLDLIAGLPYEDYESFQHSFHEVFAMKPNQLQLGFLKVLKGSRIREDSEKYGLVYSEKPPYEILGTKWLTYEEIFQLKTVEEMLEIYYNSSQFPSSLAFLLPLQKTPFDFFLALGKFYQKSGLQGDSSGRVRRYLLLQDYFGAYVLPAIPSGRKNLYAEYFSQALTYDYYLRENAKSRPPFAALPTEEEKGVIRQFFKNEESERRFLYGYENYTAKQLEKMTKMIRFQLDIEYLIQTGECREKSCYVLFDYRHRNRLNHSARVIWWKGDSSETKGKSV